MDTVRRYPSHIAAQDAVTALRASGILATGVGDSGVLGAIGLSSGVGPFAVVLRDASDLDAATRILEELERTPLQADAGWEQSAAAPVLANLDPSLRVACPACRKEFHPGDEEACPWCGELWSARDLRGRCQHADVEEILTSGVQTYSRRGQSYVDQAYSWTRPAAHTPIVSYAQLAAKAAEDCLVAVIGGVLACPGNPIS